MERNNETKASTEPTFTSAIPVIQQPADAERKYWWRYIQVILDSCVWIAAFPFSLYLRYGFDLTQINLIGLLIVIAITVLLQLGAGFAFGLYRGRYPYGSFDEGRILYPVIMGVFVIVQGLLLYYAWHLDVPRSMMVIATPFAILGMMAIRYGKRLVEDYTNRPDTERSERVLIYGGGFVGSDLVGTLMSDANSHYYPVGIVDDDLSLKNARIAGVKVLGVGNDLPHLVSSLNVSTVFFAMSEPHEELFERVSLKMNECGVKVRRYKGATSDLEPKVELTPREVERMIMEKARGPIDYEINHDAISSYIEGKRVLVTGAGGSIGSELCQQIVKYNPAELMMLDHDETLLMDSLYNIKGSNSMDDPMVVLADIRDPEALQAVFHERRPQVVFHAAALKHVAALEAYPKEAYKTNVLGSRNVLEAASQVDVEVFVNVSTDKAADPANALGLSKRAAERLTSWYGQKTGRRYVSVRFGNVFGSRGSLKPIFERRMKDGLPLYVTHEEATRYFMLIPDACLLVLLAGALGDSGNVMVLDMGDPVKIYDIAHMIRRTNESYDVDIRISELRPGEKLAEVLYGSHEKYTQSPQNRFLSSAIVPALAPTELDYGSWHQNYLESRGYNRAEHEGQQ